jgi:hypothetical protein
MSEYGGYLYVFDKSERTNHLLQRIFSEKRFSESINAVDSQLRKAELCLFSSDKTFFAHLPHAAWKLDSDIGVSRRVFRGQVNP